MEAKGGEGTTAVFGEAEVPGTRQPFVPSRMLRDDVVRRGPDPTTKDMQGNDAGEFTITALWSYGKKRSIFYFIRILNGLSMEG